MPQADSVFTAFTPVTKPEPGSGLMRVIQVSASQDCVSFVVAAGFYERNFTGRFYDLSNRVLAQCCYSTDFPAYAEILPLISPLLDDSYPPRFLSQQDTAWVSHGYSGLLLEEDAQDFIYDFGSVEDERG